MNILLKQFLGGKNHSWAVCGFGIARALKELGHKVDLFSTDGIKYTPKDLQQNIIGFRDEETGVIVGKHPEDNYDMQISYTMMCNFSEHLKYGSKNRFGIWCYEWNGKNILPNGFAKNYNYCDVLCPPSNFAKEVFLNSKIPEDKMRVIPHGITIQEFNKTHNFKFQTNKKYIFFSNIAQNHKRKNINGLLDTYGKAFTSKDNVCLVLKTSKDKKIKFPFEISVSKLIHDFYQKYPNHAELIIFDSYVEDISMLYNACDSVITLSHTEGFYFPGLEGLASGKNSVAPRYGGQLDFLNDTNSFLVDGKEWLADKSSMYWDQKDGASWFIPNQENAIKQMKEAVRIGKDLNIELNKNREYIYQNYSWNAVTSKFIELCK